MTSWLSWMISTVDLPWRTSFCYSITSGRSRGICRWDGNFFHIIKCFFYIIFLLALHHVAATVFSKVGVNVSAGSVPGRSCTHGHDHLQKSEGGREDLGHSKDHWGKTCSPGSYLLHICRIWIFSEGVSLQQEGVGVSSTMLVEKQKLNGKVKELKDSVQVDAFL